MKNSHFLIEFLLFKNNLVHLQSRFNNRIITIIQISLLHLKNQFILYGY